MGKSRDLFKKIRDTKGMKCHANEMNSLGEVLKELSVLVTSVVSDSLQPRGL